jgi:hypothetical protein
MWQPQTKVDETPQDGQNGARGGPARIFGWLPWVGKKSASGLEQAYDRFLETVKDVLSDFTTMEVNSVLVRNISADHPLTDVEFLRQTGEDLLTWFQEHSMDRQFQQSLNTDSLTQLEQLSQNITFPLGQAEKDQIEPLRKDSTACLNDKGDNNGQLHEPEASQRAEYRRFLRYLQKFLALCESDKWDEEGMLRGREQQQLRKLWELVGTTFIYAQTVVGLDGDAISRLNQQLFHATQGLSREYIEALIRFHNQNTEASARGRNNLMSILVDTLQAVFRR